MLHPEPMIESARRVPVEHLKIDPAPAALDRDRGEPRHQPPADALARAPPRYVKVFEIHPRPAEPGRKPRMEQRQPGGLAVEKGKDRLELPVRRETVALRSSSVATTASGARS